MTALELDHRFQLLALDIVRFQGTAHPGAAEVLDALRDVQVRVMGFAGSYPVLDTIGEAAAEPLYVQLRSEAAPRGAN